MNVGSLFTGGYGLDLGLEHAGHTTVWACENDPACRTVLAQQRPGLTVHDDVRNLPYPDLDPIDLLAGGFPCQDLSQAGKQAGLDGDRSGLWYAMADAVRALRPRHVLIENVAGLAAALGGRPGESALGTVTADLAEAGYVGSVFRVRASDLGAPHIRERVFIVAREAAPDAGSERLDRREQRGSTRRRTRPEGTPPSPPDPGRDGRDGSQELDREPTARLDRTPGRDAPRHHLETTPPRPCGTREATADATLTGRVRTEKLEDDPEDQRGGRRPDAPVGNEIHAPLVDWGAYAAAITRWERILGRNAPAPTDDRGRLMPEFVEWMLGYPDGWTASVARTKRLRILGNSVQVQVGQLLGEHLWQIDSERSHA